MEQTKAELLEMLEKQRAHIEAQDAIIAKQREIIDYQTRCVAALEGRIKAIGSKAH